MVKESNKYIFKTFLFILAFLSGIFFFMVSKEPSAEELLVGKWSFVLNNKELGLYANVSYTFTDRNTFAYESHGIINDTDIVMNVTGDYKLDKDSGGLYVLELISDIMTFYINGMAQPNEAPDNNLDLYKCSVSKDELILTNNEQSLKFSRIK